MCASYCESLWIDEMKNISFFPRIIIALSLVLYGNLFVVHFAQKGSMEINGFILFAVTERIIETFYTSKEKHSKSDKRDWALIGVIFAYLLAFYGSFYEHFSTSILFPVSVVWIGVVGYAISLAVRWWAIRASGDQWGIHSIEMGRSSGHRRLIREGPYDYLRHPYYLSVCLEIVSICLVMRAWRSLLVAILIVCPLEIIRGFLEEKNLLSIFGWPYLKFQHERSGFVPIKKTENYDRRKISREDFNPERRKAGL